ncbi:hypothetical protein, partial [Acinetobacter ursingii]|uniref:hypothetical protein n=1 Tax=Acinetobacter ursingii TaxID=108980 RepID=UPI001D196C48
WFGVSHLEIQIVMIFFAIPTASTVYILTQVLQADSQLIAAVISLQTLCAAMTLCLVICLGMMLISICNQIYLTLLL